MPGVTDRMVDVSGEGGLGTPRSDIMLLGAWPAPGGRPSPAFSKASKEDLVGTVR